MALYSLGGATVSLPASGRYWIADNATVVGRVTLDEDTSVWFNAVIRGDNDTVRIGARTNIQDGSVLHVDPGFPMHIGEDCTVGHMVMLHGCTIGRNCLIGIGAVILNGAKVGENCLIGANALIPEGKEIPANSVVLGSPGKVIREATETDLERIRIGAVAYQKRWREYAAGLAPQG